MLVCSRKNTTSFTRALRVPKQLERAVVRLKDVPKGTPLVAQTNIGAKGREAGTLAAYKGEPSCDISSQSL
jgi:hypothetical protein